MAEGYSISQVAERDAPALMMTEELVVCLRACTLFATTRRASGFRLMGTRVSFASELTLISNKGLDALVDAFKYLNTLQITADSMARPGGTLDRLQSTIGVPSERKSHERLMKRLEEEIKTCKLGGTDLENKLKGWRTEVERFQEIVGNTNEYVTNESGRKDDEYARYTQEIESATKLLRQGEEEGAEAEIKYKESQKYQKGLIYGVVLPETLNSSTMFEMTYTVIRLGWSWYTSGIAAQDVKKTQEELDRRRKSAETCKNQIAEAEIELQRLSVQSKQLTDFTKALKPTLKALVSLTDNLRALVLGFAAMEPCLNALISRKAETLIISQDAREVPASLADIRDFAENTKAMSAWALKIEHLAWLYGSIIQHVLIGGMETIRCDDGSEEAGKETTLDVFEASQRQQLRLQGNGFSCSMIKSQVDQQYEQKRCAMEARHAIEREKLQHEEEQAKKQARKQAQRAARPAMLKLFSRK